MNLETWGRILAKMNLNIPEVQGSGGADYAEPEGGQRNFSGLKNVTGNYNRHRIRRLAQFAFVQLKSSLLPTKKRKIEKNTTTVKEEKKQERKKMSDKLTQTTESKQRIERSLEEVNKKKTETEEKIEQLERNLEKVNKEKTKPNEETTRLESELEKEVKEKTKMEKKLLYVEGLLTDSCNRNRKLKKNFLSFTLLAFVLVVVLLCIGLNLVFKGHEINHELRLMLVGKTGAGRSASGNTILGEEVLRVEQSSASVTASCMKKNKVLDGRNITIIDTPGVMNTWLKSDQMAHHAHECISMSSADPHVILLVIRLGRFTVEERNAVKWIQENFGEEALKFTMILFTGGDLLEGKPVEKFISNSFDLQNLVDTCEGRYHVFNNYEQSKRTQVTELFEKINVMLHQNMGYFYMKEVHQKMEEKNRDMMEKLIRNEEIKRKQLKEEMKVEERRKMNEMAVKLQDEQYENKHLKAKLEHADGILFWFKVSTGILILTLIVVWFKK